LCCCLISSNRPLIEALSAATAAMTADRLLQEADADRLLIWCRRCRLEELAAAGPALLLSRRAIPGDASCSSPEDLEEAGKSDSQHDVANTAAIECLSAVSHCTVRLQQMPACPRMVSGSPCDPDVATGRVDAIADIQTVVAHHRHEGVMQSQRACSRSASRSRSDAASQKRLCVSLGSTSMLPPFNLPSIGAFRPAYWSNVPIQRTPNNRAVITQ
jgi:hypothetical protein